MNKLVDSYDTIFSDKKRVLVVLAHPDDAELYAGATIARLIADGKEVRIVKVTRGNKGSRQETISEQKLTELRTQEDTQSMEALGVKPENSVFLDISDGDVDNSLTTIGKIALQIRLFQPDLIITHNPEDVIIKFDAENSWLNHRDHRNTGKSTLDASYPYSRDVLFFPEHFEISGAKSHIVTEYLLVDYYNHEDTVHIDVTDFVDIKTKAIAAHFSQYDLEKAGETTEFFTNIDPKRKYERFRYVSVD